MHKKSKIALVACSNGLVKEQEEQVEYLKRKFENSGYQPVLSPYLYASKSVFGADAKQRAKVLMDYYEDKEITAIFDISGGDIANEILPFLDYDKILENRKCFWGYSDLTTVINSIYQMTGIPNVLYQVRNITGGMLKQRDFSIAAGQEKQFMETFHDSKEMFDGSLFKFDYTFLQGETMSGIVVGGNIRCLLKLAGTSYFPDMKGKILLLEARSGTAGQMSTYLSQLSQMGIFDQVEGILLGTFTQMEMQKTEPTIIEILREKIRKDLPVAKTRWIGHGLDSKAVAIGGYYRF